jgi:hypothetical protein
MALNCTPGWATRVRPTLEIEALVPVEDPGDVLKN